MLIEKIKEFFKEESRTGFFLKMYPYLFFGFILILLVTGFLFSYRIQKLNSEQAVIMDADGSYKFNLKSDINRLECIFEQRRCYYNNLGLEKLKIIDLCFDIDYCEGERRND